MKIDEISKKIQEASVASGFDRGVLRKWTKRPTKGKIACGLVRGGVITLEDYRGLQDSSIGFYNNMLFAFINIKFSLNIGDIANLVSVTRPTVASMAERKASETTKKSLFYVCTKRLGIENPEELYNASNNKAD